MRRKIAKVNARLIAGKRVRVSRLVALDSRNHILQAGEPAFAVFIDEVRRFLAT